MLSCGISETTIGIVIGSAFTLLGVIVNGLITFVLNRSSHNKEVEERKRREKKEEADKNWSKRERAYRDFIGFYGFMSFLVGVSNAARTNQEAAGVVGEIYAEKIKENFAKAADVMTDVILYGSKVVSDLCGEYQEFWNLESLKGFPLADFAELDRRLKIVIAAMKNELGLDNL